MKLDLKERIHWVEEPCFSEGSYHDRIQSNETANISASFKAVENCEY